MIRHLRALKRTCIRILWPAGEEPRQRHRRVASLAIAAGAVGLACSTFGAAWEASAANGDWQQAVRVQSRDAGRTIEITRYLYEVEAPQAFDLAVLTVHAEELERQAADAAPNSAIRREATVERQAADRLAQDFLNTRGMSATNKLAADPKYRTRDGGLDLRQRLRDMQREEWDPLDAPDVAARAGDAHAQRARAWTASMACSLLLPIAGMALWYRTLRPTGRGTTRPLQPRQIRILLSFARIRTRSAARNQSAEHEPQQPPDIGIGAPAPPAVAITGDEPPIRVQQIIAGISLAFGVLATVFTIVQIRAGLDENHAFAAAGQHAALVTATAAGGGVREAFRDGARFEIGLMNARQRAQSAQPGTDAMRLAAADNATALRLTDIIAAMAAPPRRDDGLAPPLFAVASATRADALAAVNDEHAGVAAAYRAGTRSNTMVISLFVVTVAGVLLDIAAAARSRARRRYLAAAFAGAAIALIIAVTQPLG